MHDMALRVSLEKIVPKILWYGGRLLGTDLRHRRLRCGLFLPLYYFMHKLFLSCICVACVAVARSRPVEALMREQGKGRKGKKRHNRDDRVPRTLTTRVHRLHTSVASCCVRLAFPVHTSSMTRKWPVGFGVAHGLPRDWPLLTRSPQTWLEAHVAVALFSRCTDCLLATATAPVVFWCVAGRDQYTLFILLLKEPS